MQTLLLLCLAATTAIAGFHGTFNGASCYSAPSSASIDSITSELTFELWVHPLSGGASVQGLGGTWDDVTGAKRTWFMWLESLKPAMYSTNSPTLHPRIIAPSAIPSNQWTHIAFTKVAGSGTSTLYVNGVSVASGVLPAAIYVNDEPLRVGCAYAGGASVMYLNGYLDNVRVWNVARNSAEVQAGMNSCGTPSGSGLVAQYNFDEGSGTTLGDTSGNGNNAPLSHGAPGWAAGDSQVCGTQDPAVAAFCDNIQSQCTSLAGECDTLRSLNHIPVSPPNHLFATNRHLYRVVPAGVVTYATARAQAQAIGAGWDLATITTTAEFNFIAGLLGPTAGATRAYTVGGFRCPTCPGFDWVTGEPFNNAFFGGPEPNNGANVQAGMDNRYGWEFNDYADAHIGGYVVGFVAEKHTAEPDSEMPDDCDASVAACNAIEADCRDKQASCPLV